MDFFEYGSPFDPDKSPVYYYPVAKIDRSAQEAELRKLVDTIDRIAMSRQDRKGLVVTPSYELRNAIVSRSKVSRSMLVNHKGDRVDQVVEQFRRMPPGTILVSPSVGTGYNFEDDAARWMAIPKIPFPDISKPINVARMAVDKQYAGYYAAQTMEQIAGRPTRSEKDWSETFLFDMNMEWYWKRNHGLLTDWFKKRLRQVQELPSPPRL
jgi:Rad3-related DNA helicase